MHSAALDSQWVLRTLPGVGHTDEKAIHRVLYSRELILAAPYDSSHGQAVPGDTARATRGAGAEQRSKR